mgnify:CR=1 FL=1
MGTKWSKIANMLPGRSANAIKNRWNSIMRKNLRQQLKQHRRHGAIDPSAFLPQMEDLDELPARKRGCHTSAEVAIRHHTSAALSAATAHAAAAAATRLARGVMFSPHAKAGTGTGTGESSPNSVAVEHSPHAWLPIADAVLMAEADGDETSAVWIGQGGTHYGCMTTTPATVFDSEF